LTRRRGDAEKIETKEEDEINLSRNLRRLADRPPVSDACDGPAVVC
jgi:hypothetical protein